MELSGDSEDNSNVDTRRDERPLPRLGVSLESLIPDAVEPIVLNFDRVSSPSSSFLDELLGRLAEKLGEEAFRRKIQIVNMTDRVRRMADVVIGQRLGRNVDNSA